jgi:diguanylate cyclase (GGDEF)-like protein
VARRPLFCSSVTDYELYLSRYPAFCDSHWLHGPIVMNHSIAPRILLIDANPDGQKLLAQSLDRTGIDFSTARSMAEGIQIAAGYQHDLIVLDSGLPDLSGMMALRTMHRTPKTANIPVVFMVGNSEKDLISDAYFEGAVDVLRKPVYPEELQARIKAVLRNQTMLHRLRYLSQNDPVTRLLNRSGMSQWIQQAADNPADFPRPYASMVVGIDQIHDYTDLMGYGATEELLRSVAASLKVFLSQFSDIERCCNRITVARGMADTFVLLLTGVESSRALSGLASNLVKAISTSYRIGNHEQFVTASVGIALAREPDTDFNDLIRFADIAFQDARRAGRSHVQMYDPSMEDVLSRRRELEQDLRLATDQQSFLLEYQPVFSLQTKQCEMVEALIRWDRPNHGVLPFQRFRTVAEENGFMGEIASWGLSQICCQLSQWQEESPSATPRRISMDLSRKQLQHPSFIEACLETIQRANIRNERVQFEISELEIMQDRDGAVEAIVKLKESGVRIVIDDFGMSFPSFLHMEQFPVDGIKLSRMFVQEIENNPLIFKLLEVLSRQASQASLPVFVDGVERESQAKILSNIGIRFAQGSYYSEPMHGDAMLPFLSQWNGSPRNKPRGMPVPSDAGIASARNASK